MKPLACALGLLLCIGVICAQVPPGGTDVVKPGIETLEKMGGDYGQVERVAVEGMPFTQALRVTTSTQADGAWMFQVGAWAGIGVERGDVLLASFWVRSIRGQPETGEARAEFGFATNGPDWARSVTQSIPVPKEWKKIDIPFEVLHDRPAGQSIAAISLGFAPQVIELAELSLTSYGKTRTVRDLPRTPSDYAGQEPDAPWRREAQQRIERHRKGDFVLTLQDAQGRPVADREIEVRLVRHAFPFGTGVAADLLLAEGPDADRYRETLRTYFNQTAIENHLKWPFWEEWSRKDGVRALRWLNEQGYPVRAHTMVWPGFANLPADIPSLMDDPYVLRNRILGRIAEATASTYGMVDEWDVANEAFTNNDLFKVLPHDEIAEWFRLTKKGDPKPRLTLNDFPPLDGAATNNAHLNAFEETIRRLLELKAPIEAIGFQCHFGSAVVPPERVLTGLDRFGKLGLPIVITEFDMDTSDDDLKARYMRDFMTAAFSHPSVAGITQWGFWEGKHWMPNAALWRTDWSLRPHGQVYVDLLSKEWTTRLTLRTDGQGRVRFRGFYGEYTVASGGKPLGKPIRLSATSSQATISAH